MFNPGSSFFVMSAKMGIGPGCDSCRAQTIDLENHECESQTGLSQSVRIVQLVPQRPVGANYRKRC